jgi:hypothetical protein
MLPLRMTNTYEHRERMGDRRRKEEEKKIYKIR